MKMFFLASAALVLVGCSSDPKDLESSQVETVTVGPTMVNCVGVGARKCMTVNGAAYYSTIKGFDYQPGYRYQLKVKKVQNFDPKNVPADASLYRYDLIKVISKTAVSN